MLVNMSGGWRSERQVQGGAVVRRRAGIDDDHYRTGAGRANLREWILPHLGGESTRFASGFGGIRYMLRIRGGDGGEAAGDCDAQMEEEEEELPGAEEQKALEERDEEAAEAAEKEAEDLPKPKVLCPDFEVLPKHRPKKFRYVYIPCDDDKPVQELEMNVPEQFHNRYEDTLHEHTRKQWITASDQSGRHKNLQRYWGANMADMPHAGPMTDYGMTETFWLQLASELNNQTQVQYYLDECGKLKGLPVNRRATRFAQLLGRCSREDEFNGDIFVGRTFRESHSDIRKEVLEKADIGV
mmetsp:Transcript_11176/g.20505  ORF Transcript_11176/g.20505 Transcript_11176/m.20505 type:complete len:298 (+) Transcript_11176:2-895(+)